MKKKLIFILVLLIFIAGMVVVNLQNKSGITSDNFSSNIDYIDKEKNIADEIQFNYDIRMDNKLEFIINAKNVNSKLHLKCQNQLSDSKINVQILNSENKTIKSIQLSKNNDKEFSISKGTYKIDFIFKSGSGKGTVDWEVH